MPRIRSNTASLVRWITVALIIAMGVVNLWSSVTPGLPSRLEWIRDLFPVEIRQTAHLFSAISGFFLLILATSLLRRKQLAWMLTIGLLIGSILSHLIKGLDVEESLFAALLLALMIASRRSFTARSDRPSIAQGIKALLGSLLFTLAYGTTGFYLLDRAYNVSFDLRGAVVQTVAMFFTEDNAGLVPRTVFGQFFADSIYLVGGITLLYAMVMLLRPVMLRGEAATAEERERAASIVRAHGRSSLARFTLLPDKAYFFSRSGSSFIAYVPKGKAAIGLGDPIGPAHEMAEIIGAFKRFCLNNDWSPGFYQTGPDLLSLYEQCGFRSLKIGEEGIVDLQAFSTKGKAAQNLRTSLNKFKKLGYGMEFHDPPVAPALLQQLRSVSDEWLQHQQGSEKRFSLGWFDDAYLRDCRIAVLRAPDGAVCAFANIIPEYQLNEVSVDLMRHRNDVPNGTMDVLFVSLFLNFQAQQVETFSLGLSALSGVGELAPSSPAEKLTHYLYDHLNHFYNFKGLHAYKDKFNPSWHSRYLVFPGYPALPDIVVGLIRADSGDRVIDYFRPGS